MQKKKNLYRLSTPPPPPPPTDGWLAPVKTAACPAISLGNKLPFSLLCFFATRRHLFITMEFRSHKRSLQSDYKNI